MCVRTVPSRHPRTRAISGSVMPSRYPQDERRSLAHGDLLQGVLNPPSNGRIVELPVVRMRLDLQRLRPGVVEIDVAGPPSRSAVVVDGGIRRDGIQPRRKRSLAPEPPKIPEYLQPDLLDAILHLRMVQHDAIADTMNPVDVTVVQVRCGVPVAPLNRLDQGFIGNQLVPAHRSYSIYDRAIAIVYTETPTACNSLDFPPDHGLCSSGKAIAKLRLTRPRATSRLLCHNPVVHSMGCRATNEDGMSPSPRL